MANVPKPSGSKQQLPELFHDPEDQSTESVSLGLSPGNFLLEVQTESNTLPFWASRSTCVPPLQSTIPSSQHLSQMKTLVIISFKDLWSSHILQFSWVAVMGPSDMNVFDERYSGSYIVFRSSDYSIALCKLNNSVSDAVTLGSRALWKHLFWAQQGQAMISPGKQVSLMSQFFPPQVALDSVTCIWGIKVERTEM